MTQPLEIERIKNCLGYKLPLEKCSLTVIMTRFDVFPHVYCVMMFTTGLINTFKLEEIFFILYFFRKDTV